MLCICGGSAATAVPTLRYNTLQGLCSNKLLLAGGRPVGCVASRTSMSISQLLTNKECNIVEVHLAVSD